MSPIELARYIDHTALKPDTTEAQVRALCNEGHSFKFATVCVMPYYVPYAFRILEDLESSVLVCTPIGFPHGAHQSVVKVAEAKKAMHDGAVELDMVMNVGALKSNHTSVVMADMMAVRMAAHEGGAIVKVIIETSLLTDDEKKRACELAGEAGVDFVKTSTGFAGGGATIDDIRLMRAASAAGIRVKASGGIRDHNAAIALIEAGADRIGTSAGPAIIAGCG